MYKLFQIEGYLTILFYNAVRVVVLSHPDQRAIIDRVYRVNNHKEIPFYVYSRTASWCARIIEVTQLKLLPKDN